jgi:hypothetical protein
MECGSSGNIQKLMLDGNTQYVASNFLRIVGTTNNPYFASLGYHNGPFDGCTQNRTTWFTR